MRRRSAVLLASAALLLPRPPAVAADAPAPLLRSDLAALPESIRRESLAAVDRACDSIREAEDPAADLWAGALFPAAALSGAAAPDPLFSAALARAVGTLARPWDAARTRDAAYLLLGAAWAGADPPPGLLDRLAKADLSPLGVADAALALVALDSFGAETAAGWDALARRPFPAAPSLADVAAAALARAARSRRLGGDGASPDVLAHVRWLAARLRLVYGGAEDPATPLDPASALLCTVLASSLPRHALASDPTLFPWDWRNHLANRLVVRQTVDPDTGAAGWDGGASGAPRLLATTQAALALRLLAH